MATTIFVGTTAFNYGYCTRIIPGEVQYQVPEIRVPGRTVLRVQYSTQLLLIEFPLGGKFSGRRVPPGGTARRGQFHFVVYYQVEY